MYDFTVLILEGAYSASVAVTLDMLAAAAKLAARVGVAIPRWRVWSAHGGQVVLSNGLSVNTDAVPQCVRPDTSVWLIPGMGLGQEGAERLQARLSQPDARALTQAVSAHAAAGGMIGASCSAVLLLQAAGVLAGRRVTTSWWLGHTLQQLEPQCEVDVQRMVIVDGPIVTAGAALAQQDLVLQVLRMRCGVALAEYVSRVLLVDGRQTQAGYALPAMFAQGNELIARLQAMIEADLPDAPTVEKLAAAFSMSSRTLARHVRAATGYSPLALIQGVRLAKARALIENSRHSIDEIAARVGYGDATALRRLMRKTMGVSPRQFRPGFAGGERCL